MSSAHERRKQPERVRRALVDGTAALVIEQGLANVTVAGVAARAGVTKGALFHHFTDRDALIAAMFEDRLDRLGRQLDDLMAADPCVTGRFTRAYVHATLASDDADRQVWLALIGALVGANSYMRRWYAWFEQRLAAHPADHDPMLEIVRLAAEGAWLAATPDVSSIDADRLRERLIAMTRSTTP